MSKSITSVKFAGASMEFAGRMQPLSVDEDGYVSWGPWKVAFSSADVYMYRHDVRAVNASESCAWVYDTLGNRFEIDIGNDDAREVAEAIGRWRMAGSQQWEAESRPRPVRRAKTRSKPKVSDDTDSEHG